MFACVAQGEVLCGTERMLVWDKDSGCALLKEEDCVALRFRGAPKENMCLCAEGVCVGRRGSSCPCGIGSYSPRGSERLFAASLMIVCVLQRRSGTILGTLKDFCLGLAERRERVFVRCKE